MPVQVRQLQLVFINGLRLQFTTHELLRMFARKESISALLIWGVMIFLIRPSEPDSGYSTEVRVLLWGSLLPLLFGIYLVNLIMAGHFFRTGYSFWSHLVTAVSAGFLLPVFEQVLAGGSGSPVFLPRFVLFTLISAILLELVMATYLTYDKRLKVERRARARAEAALLEHNSRTPPQASPAGPSLPGPVPDAPSAPPTAAGPTISGPVVSAPVISGLRISGLAVSDTGVSGQITSAAAPLLSGLAGPVSYSAASTAPTVSASTSASTPPAAAASKPPAPPPAMSRGQDHDPPAEALSPKIPPEPRPACAQEHPVALLGRPVLLSELRQLSAEEHYVRLHTTQGQELLRGRISDLEAQLPDDLGLRVHRSHWVATAAVRRLHRKRAAWVLELKDGSAVPVARPRRDSVRDWLAAAGLQN